MGAQQVGKAALSGWREVLVPGAQDPTLELALWPFSGSLKQLCAPGRVIAAETYPAEFYHHLDINFLTGKMSKRRPADRAQQASRLLDRSRRLMLELDPVTRHAIACGFGSKPEGEDGFDAFVGLLGMLNSLSSSELLYEPNCPEITQVEGWIFGQASQADQDTVR
jgi:hypothetical protein